MRSVFLNVLGISALCHTAVAALPGTRPLTENGDRSAQMVAGLAVSWIDKLNPPPNSVRSSNSIPSPLENNSERL